MFYEYDLEYGNLKNIDNQETLIHLDIIFQMSTWTDILEETAPRIKSTLITSYLNWKMAANPSLKVHHQQVEFNPNWLRIPSGSKVLLTGPTGYQSIQVLSLCICFEIAVAIVISKRLAHWQNPIHLFFGTYLARLQFWLDLSKVSYDCNWYLSVFWFELNWVNLQS